MKLLTTLLGLASLAPVLFAADLPPLTFPEGVGVNIHFTRGHTRDLDMIAAAGFKFVRMDFGWAGIERKKGEYDWSAYDELTSDLEKRGLRAVYIFDYSHGLYEEAITSRNPVNGKEQRDTASPSKPETVAAFAKWAAASAAHFKGRRIVWEIWNEPNIGFWKPKPNAKDYTTLVLATCKAVRAADPNATIVAPASSSFPWPFFEEMFKSGTLEWVDGVSVHPYRSYSKGPETAADEYLKLRTLIERYAPAEKKGMPILSGEWGYATQAKGGVSLETQAAFIARQQIANVWQGVPISIWYDWKNDGLDPNYNEHNFGTVSNNLAPKPSYVAVQTLTRELNGYRIARRLDLGSSNDFAFLCTNNAGQQKVAAWTAEKPHNAALDLGVTADDASIVSIDGQPLAVVGAGTRLDLALGAGPQYITLKKISPTLQAASAWSVNGYVPVLVRAGEGSKLPVPVTVKNPFTTPAQVTFSIESAAANERATVRLDGRQTGAAAFTLLPRKRTPEPVPYVITARLEQNGAVIGTSSETRYFVVSNPLSVSAAPAEKGLRLVIDNPSGTAFDGFAVVNAQRLPVSVAQGITQSELSTTGALDTVTVKLTERGAPDAPITDVLTAKFVPLTVTNVKIAVDGDAKVPGTATAAEATAPDEAKAPFGRVWKFTYQFEQGWKFARAIARTRDNAGFDQPKALALWVYGDNSGNSLRMRVNDSEGQAFQPSGPHLDWTGWRWVQFDLKNLSKTGHWGGKDDGIARGKLKLDTLLLVDGSRNKTEGTIYFAGPMLIY